ncbi:MAG: hypothetical protein EBQ96_02095 [Proteobacteria bacterium]|nr:hypothetical protein [Pseudomonadota bacterium]
MHGPIHLVTDQPAKAYEPKVVEAWAREDLGVTDEAKIAKILEMYKAWDASQCHEVVKSAKGGNREADVVLVLDQSDGDRDDPYKLVVAVSHTNPGMVFRNQYIANDKLRGMDAMELGDFILSKEFEYSPEKQMGTYFHASTSNVPDFLGQMQRQATQKIVHSAPERFLKSVAVYLGEIEVDDGIYSLPDRRYEDYQRLSKHLERVAQEKVRTAIKQFIRSLDQDALKTMRKARYFDQTAYTWLTGRMPERYGEEKQKWQALCANPDALRRRRQAMEAAPALVWWFAGYDRVQRAITDTLDNDGTLLEAVNAGLAETQDFRHDGPPPTITQEFLSWFGQFDVRYIDGPRMEVNPDFYHFGAQLPKLQVLPREWRPMTRDQQLLIFRIRNQISGVAFATGRKTDEVMLEFLSACRNPAGIPKSVVDLDQLRIRYLVSAINERKRRDARTPVTLRILNKLPTQWLPKSAEEARKLATICNTIADDENNGVSREEKPVYKKLGDLLERYARKFDLVSPLVKGKKADKTEIMYLVLHDVAEQSSISLGGRDTDFHKHLCNQIILTEVFRHATAAGYSVAEILSDKELTDVLPNAYGFGGDLARTVFNGMTAIKMASLSHRWHGHEARLHTRSGKYDKSAQWEPLFETFERNGIIYECLTSTAALVQEADKLGHCVRGYTHSCVIKNSHIISIRAADGSWDTTLEVQESDKNAHKRTVRIVQHEGANQVRGEKLPAHQQDAAAYITAFINKSKVDWKKIDEGRAPYRKDEMLIRIGFDYSDTKACNDAYDAWRGTFKDLFKEPTRDAYLRSRGITAMLEKRYPKRVPGVA